MKNFLKYASCVMVGLALTLLPVLSVAQYTGHGGVIFTFSPEIIGANGETMSNASDGTWDFGAANLTTTGTSTAGAQTFNGALTVGTDGVGHTVTFNSDTAGDTFVWSDTAEKLTITGTNAATALDVADGNVVIADTLDVNGTVDIDVTTAAITGTAADLTAIVLVTSNAAGGIDIDTGTSGIDVDLDATGPFAIDGDLTAIGSAGADGGTADGDNDLLVAGDSEVDGIFDVDGSVDADVTTFNVTATQPDLTAMVLNASHADSGIDINSGTRGVDIDTTGEVSIDGGVVNVGGGTPDTAAGDNDLYVTGDFEVDTVVDLDGSVDADVTTFNIAATAADITAIVLTTSNGSGGIDVNTGSGGVDIDTTGTVSIDGAVVNIGGGSPGTATGDNDLYVTEDFEVDGNFDYKARVLVVGQYFADPNAASFPVTLTGVDSTDWIIATVNNPTNGAYLLSADAFTDSVTVTLSADPGEAIRITFMAWTD